MCTPAYYISDQTFALLDRNCAAAIGVLHSPPELCSARLPFSTALYKSSARSLGKPLEKPKPRHVHTYDASKCDVGAA